MTVLTDVHLFFASAAASAGAGEGGAVSVATAALILVAGGLVFCVKELLDLRRRVGELEAAPAPAPRPAPVPAARVPQSEDAIPAHIVAVIAAAAHVALKGRARLVAVTPISTEQQLWSIEGRRQVFQSHKLR